MKKDSEFTIDASENEAGEADPAPVSDKHARILAATARLIVTNGLEFPVFRISRESGVAVGSIYNYFPSKHDLIVGVYQRLADELNAALISLPGKNDDHKARIIAYIHDYIDFFWADADRAFLFEYLSNAPLIATPEIAEMFRPLRNYNSTLFAAAQKKGILKPLPPKSMAGFVGGGVRNALKWHRTSRKTITDEEKNDIARMCWSAIAADSSKTGRSH